MSDVELSVREDLPEIELIQSDDLKKKTYAAWVLALRNSSFSRISDMPGEANPGQNVLKGYNQAAHLRGVTQLALRIADYFSGEFPEVRIDRDTIIAGALCHDVGKAWECDPVNQKRWSEDGSAAGWPSLRHPIYGAHICLTVGLPEAIAHIAACHSPEGENVKRSLECFIVHKADYAWWEISAAAGLTRSETFPAHIAAKISARALRS